MYVTTTLKKNMMSSFLIKKSTFFYELDWICILHITSQILKKYDDTVKLQSKKDSNLQIHLHRKDIILASLFIDLAHNFSILLDIKSYI